MTAPAPGIRPEVLAAILALGTRDLTAAEDELLDAATDAEWDAARAVRVAEHETVMADIRQRQEYHEERRAWRYYRWRAGHRAWDRTRPWAARARRHP